MRAVMLTPTNSFSTATWIGSGGRLQVSLDLAFTMSDSRFMMLLASWGNTNI
jgi:hypothetical protein